MRPVSPSSDARAIHIPQQLKRRFDSIYATAKVLRDTGLNSRRPKLLATTRGRNPFSLPYLRCGLIPLQQLERNPKNTLTTQKEASLTLFATREDLQIPAMATQEELEFPLATGKSPDSPEASEVP